MAVPDDDASYIKDWDRVARKIYNGTYKGAYDRKMSRWIGGKLSQMIMEQLKGSYQDLKEESPIKDMADHLLTNAYQFSVAKNYTDMKDITSKLVDPQTNKIRSWTEFKKQVSDVMDASNKYKFRTEYNFAVASAQNAFRWSTFDKDSNLKYLTANDGRVRDSHKSLHGLVFPITDSFWNTHYPPNGWGCRCYTIETMSKPTSADAVVPHVDIPAMFQVNLAKGRLLYPKDHHYFQGIPKELITEADKLNPYLSILEYKSEINPKGAVHVMPLCHTENKAFDDTFKAAKRWADEGYKMTLYPNTQDKNLRKIHFDDKVKKGKSPDTKLADQWFDLKLSNGSPSSIRDHIEHGKKQVDHLAFFIDADVSIDFIERIINGKLLSFTHGIGTLDKIWIATRTDKKQTSAAEILGKYKKQKASTS